MVRLRALQIMSADVISSMIYAKVIDTIEYNLQHTELKTNGRCERFQDPRTIKINRDKTFPQVNLKDSDKLNQFKTKKGFKRWWKEEQTIKYEC